MLQAPQMRESSRITDSQPSTPFRAFLTSLLSYYISPTFQYIITYLNTIMSTEHNNAADLEKGVTNGASHTADPETEHAAALQKIRTAGSITISPELFEKLYLSPQNAVRGDLRKTFGNPTPM